MSLSDRSHLDTCAGRYCNAMELRVNMVRLEGRRGWFCARCARKIAGVITLTKDELYLYGDVDHDGTLTLVESPYEELP